MLRELLETQRNCANHFFDLVDLSSIEVLVESLLNCRGMLFFTGVGKSGFVAKKIAFTMISTGTKAFFLSPTDALHGDLGMVSSEDTFIMLSKSGESDELLHLLPAIKNKGAHVVAVVCHAESRLARASDAVIHLPLLTELCPYNLAPTTSSSIQLLFGDLLTIALMQRKNFSMDQYALNHPSGSIGKRITLKVKDLMLKEHKIPICRPNDILKDVLTELSEKRCGCLLVANDERLLLGLFTDGDLRRGLQHEGSSILEKRIEDFMNKNPSHTHPDTLAWDALKLMEASRVKRITNLPVLDENGKIQGLIHLHDIIQSGL